MSVTKVLNKSLAAVRQTAWGVDKKTRGSKVKSSPQAKRTTLGAVGDDGLKSVKVAGRKSAATRNKPVAQSVSTRNGGTQDQALSRCMIEAELRTCDGEYAGKHENLQFWRQEAIKLMKVVESTPQLDAVLLNKLQQLQLDDDSNEAQLAALLWYNLRASELVESADGKDHELPSDQVRNRDALDDAVDAYLATHGLASRNNALSDMKS